MEQLITGKAFVLGDDIDTDQIIPAEHLVYSLEDSEERKKYGQFALSSVPASESGLPDGNILFVEPDNTVSEYQIVIGGKNFGCGSSREHAPVALKAAGIRTIIAKGFARIFYRNAFNIGLSILESDEAADSLEDGDEAFVDLATGEIVNKSKGKQFSAKPIPDFMREIIQSGGLVEYIKKGLNS